MTSDFGAEYLAEADTLLLFGSDHGHSWHTWGCWEQQCADGRCSWVRCREPGLYSIT